MKKLYRKLSLILAVSIMFLANAAYAANTDDMVRVSAGEDHIRASYQLDSYAIGLTKAGSGKLKITYDVWGTHPMDCIGAQLIVLEEEVAPGVWREYTAYTQQFTYNSITHADVLYVSVFPGTRYRATLTAYARDSRGYDTGKVTSYTVLAG